MFKPERLLNMNCRILTIYSLRNNILILKAYFIDGVVHFIFENF